MDVTDKRVTLIISSLAGGGAEGVCVNVANGLVEEGWRVDLVVLNLNNAAYQDRVSKDVNLVVLDVNHALYSVLPLLRYMCNEKPRAVLVFTYELAAMLLMIRSVFRLKVVIIARNINTLSFKFKHAHGAWRNLLIKPIIDHYYCRVDHVINQCDAMRNDLIAIYPQLADKSSIIYNPVAKYIEDYARSHDLSKLEKQDYLLCVGRLEKQKAFHYAIEVFSGLARQFPNMRLKIVGQGSLEQKLKQVAVDSGVADRVDFEGFQKDMIPFYLHARATLLTSLYEGFPNVLVESITLGTPVVAFSCPSGPSEIIQDGVNGYLVEYQNAEDFIDKVRQLLLERFVRSDIQTTAKQNLFSEVVKLYSSRIESILRR